MDDGTLGEEMDDKLRLLSQISRPYSIIPN